MRAKTLSAGLLCLWMGAACHSLPAAKSPERLNHLPPFALEDSNGKMRTIAPPYSRPLLLIAADRQGSRQIEPWVEPLFNRFRNQIEIIGVAHVAEVSESLRSLVRLMFRKEQNYPVLLDWEGELTGRLPMESGRVLILVVHADGRILVQSSGEASDRQLRIVSEAIQKALPP